MKAASNMLGALVLLLSLSSYSQEITVLTEDYKPFQYNDAQGEPTGFGVELIKQLFADAHINIKDDHIRILPWARAYNRALDDENTAVFMTVRTPKREALFKWVGPLAERTMWLYKLRHRSDIQLNSLEDAKQYLIGGYNQSADTLYMAKLGFQIVTIPEQKLITSMLINERIDLMSSQELTMAVRLQDLGKPLDTVEQVLVLDSRYKYYLALNLQTPDKVVAKLQAALNQLKLDGSYERLQAKYLDQYLQAEP